MGVANPGLECTDPLRRREPSRPLASMTCFTTNPITYISYHVRVGDSAVRQCENARSRKGENAKVLRYGGRHHSGLRAILARIHKMRCKENDVSAGEASDKSLPAVLYVDDLDSGTVVSGRARA